MSEYPFNLQGKQENWQGTGLTASETQEGHTQCSQEFLLEQGVVIAEIAHHGYGDFKLQFISTEGFSKGETTTASIGGAFASGAATGAALGSIIPGAGTIAGALLGGAVGYFTSGAIRDAMEPGKWTLVDYKGKFNTYLIVRIKDDESALPPGKYHLEATSNDRWTCRFIQPELGQALDTLEAEDYGLNEAGYHIMGPYICAKSALAHIRYSGRGEFYAAAYSVDGTHACTLFEQEGPFHVEGHPTEIIPDKEYFLYVSADSESSLTFNRENDVFEMVFLMIGKMAKADLHVSEDEINAIEALITESGLSSDKRKTAIESFNEGKTTSISFKAIAAEFAQHADIEFRQNILYELVKIAAADGVLHATEEGYLNDVIAAFGVSPDVLTKALEEILPNMQKYYKILDCDPSVSDDELKRCYRILCRQYHPDQISSKNLAPDFHEFAKEKFREIQEAYETITKHRQSKSTR